MDQWAVLRCSAERWYTNDAGAPERRNGCGPKKSAKSLKYPPVGWYNMISECSVGSV